MCILICGNPKLTSWLQMSQAFDERDHLMNAAELVCHHYSFHHVAERFENEELRTEEVYLIETGGRLPQRPTIKTDSPLCRGRITKWKSHTVGALESVASSHKRKCSFDFLADAWHGLLILFGWRR